MTPRKLNILIATFPYAGNGSIAGEHPDLRKWYLRTIPKMKEDPRIGEVKTFDLSETPITMSRNASVLEARRQGCDLLLMIDSDMQPDCEHSPVSKPFWDTSFDFVYNHYDRGPCMVGAPYCGPPGGTENVYVFRFDNYGYRGAETPFALEAYSRSEAFNMAGIQPCGALPTGLILYDMRCFDLIEPSKLNRSQVLDKLLTGEFTKQQALSALRTGFFEYEWTDGYASQKASTEDVQNTRDIGMACALRYGYNPVYCNWDAWAGHWKPWCVGKPRMYCTEQIAENFKAAVEQQRSAMEQRVFVGQELVTPDDIPVWDGKTTVPAPEIGPGVHRVVGQHDWKKDADAPKVSVPENFKREGIDFLQNHAKWDGGNGFVPAELAAIGVPANERAVAHAHASVVNFDGRGD